MANDLTPNYLNIDFDTVKSRFKELLQSSETFRDFDYEGSNISVLIEMLAYITELNTFYLNKLAKNTYIDTADLYENVHRLANFLGYAPKGYVSAKAELTVTLTQEDADTLFSYGDDLVVEAFTRVYDESGSIPYVVPRSLSLKIEGEDIEDLYEYSFGIPVVQGERVNLEYRGMDVVDNQIVLPFYSFDFSDNVGEDVYVSLSVEDQQWERVTTFYDNISGLSIQRGLNNQVFRLVYDKYQRYIIEFAPFRGVPKRTDNISVTLFRTMGKDGVVGANMLTSLDGPIVHNATKNAAVPVTATRITNEFAALGSADPEDVDEIKQAAKGYMHAQHRCVTRRDYVTHLESLSNVVAGNVWGEKEHAGLEGDIFEYNKVHVSVIPYSFNTNTLEVSAQSWTPFDDVQDFNLEVYRPKGYAQPFKDMILEHLEPQKMPCVYEVFDVPELVYFAFRFDVSTKRLFNFTDVSGAIKRKLAYYFEPSFRSFNERVSFMDIHNFILDPSVRAPRDPFDRVRGIENLVFREIKVLRSGAASVAQGAHPHGSGHFPRFTMPDTESYDNKLKVIQLGNNQFPVLARRYNLYGVATDPACIIVPIARETK
jgi:hypothetical protein